MKLAIVSDIHGNLEALETVLGDSNRRGVERYYCLGDFVGYGAAPNECIDRLRPLIDGAVAGNHDLAACGRIRLGYFNPDAATAARWTAETLRPDLHLYLRELPWTEPWHGAFMVHASPAEPDQWHYVFSPGDAAHEMDSCPAPLCFIGHSHVPGNFELEDDRVRYHREAHFELHESRRYLINVPSVGQPRDGDPRAGYLVWDTDERTLEHVRLEYDIPSAMGRIRAAGLPTFLADRLQWGE